MRTIRIRPIAFAIVATLAMGSQAMGQGRMPGLLNTLEVRQLVERGEPADHARLSAHFTVLADRYSAEAKRHTTMAESFVGNPNRSLGSSMSAHCRRLADLNTQSATTVRELAVYHEKATAGVPATKPEAASRFDAGQGAAEASERELAALAAKARTPAEHRALEEYFLTLAKRYTADAGAHANLAQTYRGTRIAQAAVHHERLLKLSNEAAKEATDAAAMHKQLADVGR